MRRPASTRFVPCGVAESSRKRSLLDILDDGVDVGLRLGASEHVVTTADDLQVRVVADKSRGLGVERGLAQVRGVSGAARVE